MDPTSRTSSARPSRTRGGRHGAGVAPLQPRRTPTASVRVGQIAGRGVRLPAALVPMGTVLTSAQVQALNAGDPDEIELLEDAEEYAAMVAAPDAGYRAQVLEGMLQATYATRHHGSPRPAADDPIVTAFNLAVATVAWYPPAAELLLRRGFSHEFLGPAVETADLAARTGARLGFPQERLVDLTVAALMADAGMLLIPDHLAAKLGRLTGGERCEMQEHVRLGADLLEPLRNIAPCVPAVAAQHHERVDGTGYPKGLAGAQVSVEAQIVAVSHRYLAATTPRPYRAALPLDDAMRMIVGLGGCVAEPEIVAAFCAAVDPYPPGSFVRLSDGRGGRVLERGAPGARHVRLLWDGSGEPIPAEDTPVGPETGLSVTAVSLARSRAALENPSMEG